MKTEIVGDEVEIRGVCGVGRLTVREGLTLEDPNLDLASLGSLTAGSLDVTGTGVVQGDMSVSSDLVVGGSASVSSLTVGGVEVLRPFIRHFAGGGTVQWVTIGPYGLWDLTTLVGESWSLSENGSVGFVNGNGHFEATETGLAKFEIDASLITKDGGGNVLDFSIYKDVGSGDPISSRKIYSDITLNLDNYFHAKMCTYVNIESGHQYLMYTRGVSQPVKPTQVKVDFGVCLSVSMVKSN